MARSKSPSRNVAPDIEISQISDPTTRKNFQNIKQFLENETPLTGFRFVEFTIPAAKTNFQFHHSLGFVPRDVIIARVTGAGSVTFNFDKFDDQSISVTSTDACHVRAFIGTYQKDTSAATLESAPQPQTWYTAPVVATNVTNVTTAATGPTYKKPLITTLTASSGIFTPDPLALYRRVKLAGGGGGGAGASTSSPVSGAAGGTTSFGAWTAIGGGGGNTAGGLGGVGGVKGTGTEVLRTAGGSGTGSGGTNQNGSSGGQGGSNWFGGSGGGGYGNFTAGATNAFGGIDGTGGGGGGGGTGVSHVSGGGGGAGECVEFISTESSPVAFAVGPGGTHGSGNQTAGGDGGRGTIIVEEYYQ